jgi:hypothetical protein
MTMKMMDLIGPALRFSAPPRPDRLIIREDHRQATAGDVRGRLEMRALCVFSLVVAAAAGSSGAQAEEAADPVGLIGELCPVIRSMPELPLQDDLPAGWTLITEAADAPGADEWEVPVRVTLLTDRWTIVEWIDPYAGAIELDARYVSADAGEVDSVCSLVLGLADALSELPGNRIWRFDDIFAYVLQPFDSLSATSDSRLWVRRASESTVEIGCTVALFHGEAPYSLHNIPEDDRMGMLSRLDLRWLAVGRLIRIVEEDGLYDWAGEDCLSYSSTIPEGAEIDPLQSMVEITVREVHDTQGDPMTAPAVGYFLVQPVSGEAMMMDRLTGEYGTIR